MPYTTGWRNVRTVERIRPRLASVSGDEHDLVATVLRAIDEERQRRGLSRAHLARGLGLAPPQVTRRFKGETPLTVAEVEALAHLFEIPPIQLLTGVEPSEAHIQDVTELHAIRAIRTLRSGGLPNWELAIRIDGNGELHISMMPLDSSPGA